MIYEEPPRAQQTNPQKYRFCPKCGAKISETASFCGQCGFSAFAQTQTPYNYNTIQNETYPPFTENYYRYNYMNSQNPRKLSSWVVALIVLLVVIFVVVPGIFAAMLSNSVMNEKGIFGEDFLAEILPNKERLPNNSTEEQGESLLPNGVSIKEYNDLELGMSYAEVSFLVGGDALAEDTDSESDEEFIAVWAGEYKPEATVSITFVDDKVTHIEQVGLF